MGSVVGPEEEELQDLIVAPPRDAFRQLAELISVDGVMLLDLTDSITQKSLAQLEGFFGTIPSFTAAGAIRPTLPQTAQSMTRKFKNSTLNLKDDTEAVKSQSSQYSLRCTAEGHGVLRDIQYYGICCWKFVLVKGVDYRVQLMRNYAVPSS